MKATMMNNRVASFVRLIGCVVALNAYLQPARAEDRNWTAVNGGDFEFWGNWSPWGMPGSADTAVFDLPSDYFIHLETPVITNKRLTVEDGMVTFLMGTPGNGCDGPVTYNLLGSGSFIRTAATIGVIAHVPATLRIRHSVSQCDPDSHVNADGMLLLGQVADSNGTLVLGDSTAQSTTWSSAYPTVVGSAGDGALEIQKADELINGSGILGSVQGAFGSAEVWGRWTNNGSLTVGNNGYGTIAVYHTLSNSGDAYIGKEPWSVGTVNIEPVWGQTPTPDGWLCGGSLYVGGSDDLSGGLGIVYLRNSGYIQVDQGTTVWNNGSINVEAGFFQANDVDIRGWGHITVDGFESQTGAMFDCANLDIQTNGTLEVVSQAGFATAESIHSEGTIDITDGWLFVDNQLSVPPGGEVRLAHGTINVGSLSAFQGTFTWFSGTLNVNADGLRIDVGEPLGDDVSISSAHALHVASALEVGPVSSGVVTLTGGGTMSSNTGVVGSLLPTATHASVVLAGANTSWTMAGDLQVHGVNDAQLALFGGATVSNANAFLAAPPGTLAEVSLAASGTAWNCNGSLFAGGNWLAPGGTGTLEIDNSAELSVSGTLKVWDDFVVEIDGGSVVTTDLEVFGDVVELNSGSLEVNAGTADFYNAGSLTGAIIGSGATEVALHDPDTIWTTPGSILVGTNIAGSGHISHLTLEPGATVSVAEMVNVLYGGAFTMSGGTINADTIMLPNDVFSGFGTLHGDVTTNGTITATGDLVVGDLGSQNGVQLGEALNIGPHHVSLNTQGMLFAAGATSLGGGTLSVPFGMRLTAGDHVHGHGLIDTPDDAATPLINDGSINGFARDRRIELAGYLKGLGTLNNVTITGTDAPGLGGPAAVDRGSVAYEGKLAIDIRGLTPGSRHDQINHSGTADLGGELAVELINGFEPAPGDRFVILTYAMHNGQFDTLTLPTLASGHQWDVEYGRYDLTLVVTGQIAGNCDLDADIDLLDHALFESCLAGPDASSQAGCGCLDMNSDGTIDMADYALFQAVFTGAQ